MPIVFCTPNGWDLRQHEVLSEASIRAGIVVEGDAEDRLWFLTEGEASVHYALAHTKTVNWLNQGTVFAVMDVGGSTVDSTLYRCQSRAPLVLEEACASACVQAGGIFVDQSIREVLKRKLNGSEYSDPESISLMIRQFERQTKRAFDGSQTTNQIRFGSTKDNDKKYDIVKGKLTLSCEEVEEAYLAVICNIVDSCNTLLANQKAEYLILVGGFGESPYLRNHLKCIFEGRGTEVVTVEEPSDGAVIWYLTELVEGRAARFDYGIIHGVIYDARLHSGYEDKCFVDREGTKRICTFKDTIFNDHWERLLHEGRMFLDPSEPSFGGNIGIQLFSWRGEGSAPHVLDLAQTRPSYDLPTLPGLEEIILIEADIGVIIKPETASLNRITGKPYWNPSLRIELSFKSMKLRARIRWSEEGVERIGPASVIPITRL
ncbi:hypothetical protein FS842_001106 [Serendipita sp. 407]|nr:hypothetical protein FS842_001106 [Serendipita sp. 407]